MIWHVLPVNDLKEHEESSTCECSPEVLHIDGNMVIVHNSFDGREGVEMVRKILENE